MLRLWGFDGGWVWEVGGVLFLLISREGLRFFFFFYMFGEGYLGGHGVYGSRWSLVGGWFNGRHLDGGQAGDTTMERFPGFLLLLGHGLMGQDEAWKRARQHGGR